MSHNYGQVWSEQGALLGHFEYDGTVDVACTSIHKDKELVWKYWRTPSNCARCTCGKPSQPVVLYTDYGWGMYWKGAACLDCMAITGGIHNDEYTDGHPFFDEWMTLTFGKVLPCPACGAHKLRSDGDLSPVVCDGCGALWHSFDEELEDAGIHDK